MPWVTQGSSSPLVANNFYPEKDTSNFVWVIIYCYYFSGKERMAEILPDLSSAELLRTVLKVGDRALILSNVLSLLVTVSKDHLSERLVGKVRSDDC